MRYRAVSEPSKRACGKLTIANVGIKAPYSRCVRAMADFLASPFGFGNPIASIEIRGIPTIQAIQLMMNAGIIHITPSNGDGQSKPPIVTLVPRRIAAGR
jgi:hypothetical protein